MLVFAAGCEQKTPEGANYSFDCAISGNPESLDPQFASDVNSMTVIGNMFTGLMQTDESGKLVNGVAKDYTVSENGLEYTFTLRDDCSWFFDSNENEKADANEVTPVTAYDFEFAFKRLFNPETCSPHREKYECIKNAALITSGAADYNELGVKALSDTKLVFELDYASAGFLNSLSFTAAMPCNENFFNSTKGRYGLDERSVASNGAFFIRQWFYDPYGKDNFIYMKRNSENNDFDRIYPSYLNFYIKKSNTQTQEAFENGMSNVLLTFENDQKKYKGNEISSCYNYTFGIVVNPTNASYSNKSIRKALAYGIDKEAFAENIPDDMQAAYGIVPPGVTLLNRSYREINSDRVAAVSDNDGEMIEYNPQKAVEFFETGMSQMGLQSLENIKILVPENYIDVECLHLVTQNWQSLFGFYIGIEEVPEEDYYYRLESGDYVMAMYPLSGDYNNPLAVFEKYQENINYYGAPDASLSSVLDDIRRLENYNAGVELYLKAEKKILNNFEFIPVFYKMEHKILDAGNHDILFDPFSKQLFFRYAKYYE